MKPRRGNGDSAGASRPDPGPSGSPRKIRLDIAYVGTSYSGWQIQPDSPTVQGTLEAALEQVLRRPARVHGSGRTDAGVHARGQVAHFETDSALPVETLQSALNHFLPWDIQVLRASDAAARFHARESAESKEYRYHLLLSEVMPPHRYPFTLRCAGPLDVGAMRRAAALLVGVHDFASLRSAGSATETTVRRILRSEWLEDEPELVYRIEGDGFLYKMVRAIVGTLLEVGRGRRSEASVLDLTRARDRSLAGPVLPARGLHLWQVRYPDGQPERPEPGGNTTRGGRS